MSGQRILIPSSAEKTFSSAQSTPGYCRMPALSKNSSFVAKNQPRYWGISRSLQQQVTIYWNTSNFQNSNTTLGDNRYWFMFGGRNFLIVADYYLKYSLIKKIPKGNSNSRAVVNLRKNIFLSRNTRERDQWKRASVKQSCLQGILKVNGVSTFTAIKRFY